MKKSFLFLFFLFKNSFDFNEYTFFKMKKYLKKCNKNYITSWTVVFIFRNYYLSKVRLLFSVPVFIKIFVAHFFYVAILRKTCCRHYHIIIHNVIFNCVVLTTLMKFEIFFANIYYYYYNYGNFKLQQCAIKYIESFLEKRITMFLIFFFLYISSGDSFVL